MADPLQRYQEQQRQHARRMMGMSLMAGGLSGQGMGPGLMSAMQFMPPPMDPMAAMNYQKALTEQQQLPKEREAAYGMLGGGTDPRTGIQWKTGRVDSNDPERRVGPQGLPYEASLMAGTDPSGLMDAVRGRMMKDPMFRETKRGDEVITERLDRRTGEMGETGRAPRYKPGDVNVAGTDFESLGKFMTSTQRGKEIADLRNQRVQAVQMVKQGAGLIKGLQEGGDQTVSWSGAMLRGGDTLVSQGRAIAKDFGMNLNTGDWDWGNLATESSITKSKILGLAVAITKADQGSRPSDFDVQTSIERIAGASGSASRTAAVVDSLLREKMGDFTVRYNTLAPDYGLSDFDWQGELQRHKIEIPELQTGAPKPRYTDEEIQREMQRRGL